MSQGVAFFVEITANAKLQKNWELIKYLVSVCYI